MSDDDHIHPADRATFDRLGPGQHGFDLNCLPCSFSGPIRTAPIVLLYLSPGLSPDDGKLANSERGKVLHRRNRHGSALLPDREDHAPAFKWWSSRTKCFGTWQEVRPHVAILNIGGYHSSTFTDWQMLASLPSSRASLDWAQNYLFPDALADRRMVVCLRSARFWGIGEGRHGASLYAPPVTRSGHMRHGPLRDEIVQAASARIAQAALAEKAKPSVQRASESA